MTDKDDLLIGELLGRGGMGNVYAARHKSGKHVAVKRMRNTLRTDRLMLDRFADEARLLKSVSHPNVVRALGAGMDTDGVPFLVMDRAHGTPLDVLIKRDGPLTLHRAVYIALQLLAGLEAIHKARIVHADMKSNNVLVDENDRVTIVDFGLARTVTQSHRMNLIAGTPAYMAPEVIGGDPPSMHSDVYAVGAIVYEMLTGTPPFSGPVETILANQLCDSIQPPSQRAPKRAWSTLVDAVVLRALNKAPTGRYASVAEFASALEGTLSSELALPTIPNFAARRSDDDDTRTTRLRIRPDLEAGAKISKALEDAHTMIGARQVTEAAEHLEGVLTSLAQELENQQAPVSAPVWRIELVLAAIYDNLGKRERARRMALIAYQHAVRAGNIAGETRARDLMSRLNRPRLQSTTGPQLARGSTRIPIERPTKRLK